MTPVWFRVTSDHPVSIHSGPRLNWCKPQVEMVGNACVFRLKAKKLWGEPRWTAARLVQLPQSKSLRLKMLFVNDPNHKGATA